MVEDRFEYINEQYKIIEILKKEIEAKKQQNLSTKQINLLEEEKKILDDWCEELRNQIDKWEKENDDLEQEEKRRQSEENEKIQKNIDTYYKEEEKVFQALNELKKETEQKINNLIEEEYQYIEANPIKHITPKKKKERKVFKIFNKLKKSILRITPYLLIGVMVLIPYINKKSSNAKDSNTSQAGIEQSIGNELEKARSSEKESLSFYQEEPVESNLEEKKEVVQETVSIRANSYIYSNANDALNEENGMNPYYETGNNGVERKVLGYVLQDQYNNLIPIYITEENYQLKIQNLQQRGYVIASVLTATLNNYENSDIKDIEDINMYADGWYNYDDIEHNYQVSVKQRKLVP